MSIDELLSTKQVADLLNTNTRTVTRYANEGLLDHMPKTNGFFFKKEDVESLKLKIDAYEKLKSHIKEMYVLQKCETELDNIACQFEVKEDGKEVALALEQYERRHNNQLKQFNLDEKTKKDALLVEEVCARLKIGDYHVVYDLIANGILK